MPKAFTPVFLAREIRDIEQTVLSQPAPPPLMARAGVAVAELARILLGDRGKRVLLLAGPGNNAGVTGPNNPNAKRVNVRPS